MVGFYGRPIPRGSVCPKKKTVAPGPYTTRPGVVHELLALVTETFTRFLRCWFSLTPPREKINAHWGLMHRGILMLRDDSAMNFSPAIYDEFIRPFDQQPLQEFGGSAMHFCGRGDHYIESASRMQGLYAVNLSQPEYNGMETIYRNTVDKGIKLIGLNNAAAREALQNGRDLHSNVQC